MSTKNILAALCLSATGASFSAFAGESTAHVSSIASGSKLTRAEVLADLALWKRAGLLQMVGSELSPDFTSLPYRQLYDEYLRLRSTDALAQEASRLVSLQGEAAEPAKGR
ncbi:DUF4148 domain-containing protein [Comamonas sp. Y33R10-2]|uniref:DUF4148 domain-containing protein n=1 Tax=Comamonas sp. Y33R10-2 TaxID=2853257 RepID=UPI001C5CB86B|nr:DUF4148 domain-containing protein [Comamonas sp. Y33R10-2]QXZ10849.1 DUF4148 domain-containing protein [Comamonas sp. Y33R10-2]